MSVILAWLTWAWEFVKLVPARWYIYAGLLLIGFFAGCSCARGDEPKTCPVNGVNCTCGCRQGKPCNCALTREAPERLSRLDPQAAAYFALIGKLKVGNRFSVLIGEVTPRPYGWWVRWDAYPDANGRKVIQGIMTANGPFEYVEPVQYQRPPLTTFGGACRS